MGHVTQGEGRRDEGELGKGKERIGNEKENELRDGEIDNHSMRLFFKLSYPVPMFTTTTCIGKE